ncbi:MAG TPA: bifunctional UDP-N-acetylglucosamine diphosphorylase/glucosamine-1-phosphate N-acetyltransferase GlmU [Stackebrandtia sp.]|uniref:bifunctional UDP-N-acetylglucosamine diphosphorylase/glucosamine-1-phosphate N-acetyltransferase GlmU n=1 Tax=Stackebrandtia sp. TaxID=2023065 RepID=UPI002D407D40|nr:bifunctional UDP-N-acetylglucosamine diphosphorylase/glucosamine-1-phosphate N-acetyltransferase GlmU [Stackebrandtia sp.]HZE40736.1 bifunctional UDP-N-acetylglucosamine diphosphorylase/glucosamine-1-phosphate N-acetyltransferase GlmU [Stackebrandtia sp.]
MSVDRTVIVLAAGQGTRMKSSLPKCMMPMLGRSLLGHVLFAAEALGAGRTMVVVGHEAERMSAHVAEIAPYAATVLQAQQRGTGHAVRVAADALGELSGTVVVLYGDTPLLRRETLAAFMGAHEAAGNSATVLTAEVADPAALGRIVRDADGGFESIVEFRDASPGQRAIREINSGIYAFDAGALREMLSKLVSDNDQGEEYLTDVLGMLRRAGRAVGTHTAEDVDDTLGANDRAQLAQLQAIMRDRVNGGWMRSGVSMDDPSSTLVDVTVRLEPDVTLRPGVQLRGDTVVESHAEVGPDSTLVDTSVGAGASVVRAHCVGAVVGAGCAVGPFAYLRPGAVLGEGAKAGTYVEVKNSTVGSGAKVPHLSYVGDASIGADANLGAGTIVANYDGVAKHRTDIGEAVFVGSNSVLVAPVTVADGSYVAAGSAIAEDVPSGSLGVARGRQHNSQGWVAKRRPGTKTDEAAQRSK